MITTIVAEKCFCAYTRQHSLTNAKEVWPSLSFVHSSIQRFLSCLVIAIVVCADLEKSRLRKNVRILSEYRSSQSPPCLITVSTVFRIFGRGEKWREEWKIKKAEYNKERAVGMTRRPKGGMTTTRATPLKKENRVIYYYAGAATFCAANL